MRERKELVYKFTENDPETERQSRKAHRVRGGHVVHRMYGSCAPKERRADGGVRRASTLGSSKRTKAEAERLLSEALRQL